MSNAYFETDPSRYKDELVRLPNGHFIHRTSVCPQTDEYIHPTYFTGISFNPPFKFYIKGFTTPFYLVCVSYKVKLYEVKGPRRLVFFDKKYNQWKAIDFVFKYSHNCGFGD